MQTFNVWTRPGRDFIYRKYLNSVAAKLFVWNLWGQTISSLEKEKQSLIFASVPQNIFTALFFPSGIDWAF
jgi:hypothetical protein